MKKNSINEIEAGANSITIDTFDHVGESNITMARSHFE
jgi:hypothetical protein